MPRGVRGVKWTADMAERVRAEYPLCTSVAESGRLAGSLGVSRLQLQNYAQRIKVASGVNRAWTAEDALSLRSMLADNKTAPEIAQAMCRRVSAVHAYIARNGLSRYSLRPYSAADDEAIRSANAAGESDVAIAACLKRDRHSVSRRRQKLGLPSNAREIARRRSIPAQMRTLSLRSGLHSLGHARGDVYRRWCAAQGWPDVPCIRAVQILNTLCDDGPGTLGQLKDRAGIAPGHKLSSNQKKGPAGIMGWLESLGLAHGIRKAAVGKDGRKRGALWFPSGEAMARRQAWVAKQKETT